MRPTRTRSHRAEGQNRAGFGGRVKIFPLTRRGPVSARVRDAIDEGFTDPQAADDLCLVVQERLVECETYDELLFRPFGESVEAICKRYSEQSATPATRASLA